jgi:putative transposase
LREPEQLREELLNGEIFTTLREAQALIENWRRHYNAVRPHSSFGHLKSDEQEEPEPDSNARPPPQSA